MVDGKYFPYFRGKQFELMAIRETATRMSQSGVVPIIEPVKLLTSPLERALEALQKANGRCILVVNPNCGDFSKTSSARATLLEFVKNNLSRYSSMFDVGILLTEKTSFNEVKDLIEDFSEYQICLIHAGYPRSRELQTLNRIDDFYHVFISNCCKTIYRKSFNQGFRVILEDGFIKTKNADYPPEDFFSELHLTYSDASERFDGFGDYLMVGKEYSEGGGPALAVAIHLTFIDSERDSVMYTAHFVSDSNNTPTDPAGKYLEALEKMMNSELIKNKVVRSSAIEEFKKLYERKHFPGLGYVKKLSMIHHIETICEFINAR